MIAAFHENGWPIGRFNGNAQAGRDQDYADRNAEVWETAGREIRKGNIALPDDSKLHAQMTDRFRNADQKGRIKCESKDDMRERGVPSPDRADAVMMAIAIRTPWTGTKVNAISSWMKNVKEHAADSAFTLEGADLGRY
jgi:hypothetical protein